MLAEDVEKEVERLKNRKKELSTKLSLIRNSEEKETIKKEIKKIEEQINLLEKLKTT
jgi:seryl-tRNA synthetase